MSGEGVTRTDLYGGNGLPYETLAEYEARMERRSPDDARRRAELLAQYYARPSDRSSVGYNPDSADRGRLGVEGAAPVVNPDRLSMFSSIDEASQQPQQGDGSGLLPRQPRPRRGQEGQAPLEMRPARFTQQAPTDEEAARFVHPYANDDGATMLSPEQQRDILLRYYDEREASSERRRREQQSSDEEVRPGAQRSSGGQSSSDAGVSPFPQRSSFARNSSDAGVSPFPQRTSQGTTGVPAPRRLTYGAAGAVGVSQSVSSMSRIVSVRFNKQAYWRVHNAVILLRNAGHTVAAVDLVRSIFSDRAGLGFSLRQVFAGLLSEPPPAFESPVPLPSEEDAVVWNASSNDVEIPGFISSPFAEAAIALAIALLIQIRKYDEASGLSRLIASGPVRAYLRQQYRRFMRDAGVPRTRQ